jgi:hypothetical protein
MATLTLRNVKGSILTFQEMDSNFLALDSATANLFNTKTADDLSPGSANFYYTTTRFDSDFGDKTTDSLSQGTINLYYNTNLFDSDFGDKTTDNLTQGSSNKYYTSGLFDSDLALKNTDNLAEGSTNLYYTTVRFDSDFGDNNTDDLSEGSTNVYYTDTRFDTRLATKTTDQLTEGSNLYYTTARVDSAIDVHLGSSSGIFLDTTEKLYYSNVFSAEGDLPSATTYHGMFAHVHGTGRGYFAHAGNWVKLLDSDTGVTTSQVTEGSGLYYTTARFDSDFGDNSTTDLSEGSNLYYTQSRVDSAFDVRLATKTTDNLTEGSNLYYTTARHDSDTGVYLGASTGIFLATTDKLYYSNVFSAEGDLPSATTYHGMFAHVHGTGKGYFAHAGNWVKLLDETSSTTSNLSEGTNLYYTTARFDSDFGDNSTSDLTEGTNLYYTTTRFDSDFNDQTTTNLSEGTNLYYTKARVDSDIASSFVSYDMTGASASTTSTTQTAIATFAAATYSGAKAVITASDSDTSVRQISELLITHNNTTAEAVQYATVCTSGTDDDVATYDVDLSSGNVRILATSASTNTTNYKVALTLLD